MVNGSGVECTSVTLAYVRGTMKWWGLSLTLDIKECTSLRQVVTSRVDYNISSLNSCGYILQVDYISKFLIFFFALQYTGYVIKVQYMYMRDQHALADGSRWDHMPKKFPTFEPIVPG
jgi:hypothetical protein